MSKHMRNANERHSTYSKFVVLNLLFFDKHHKYIWLYESLNCIPIIIFLHHLYLNICVFMSLYWSGNLGISWSIFQEIPEIPGILGDSWISWMNSGNSRIYWNFRKFMYSLNSRNYCNIYTVFPWIVAPLNNRPPKVVVFVELTLWDNAWISNGASFQLQID